MTSEDGRLQEQDKRINYEDAMEKAFSEIFQNLKEIEKHAKVQRQRIDMARRCSAPATMRRDTATVAQFHQSKEKLTSKVSAQVSTKPSLSRERSRSLSTPPMP